MSHDSRFAIRERDDLKHRLRRAEDMNNQYLLTIKELRSLIAAAHETMTKALRSGEWEIQDTNEVDTLLNTLEVTGDLL